MKKCTECECMTPFVDQVAISDDDGETSRIVCVRCKVEKHL